MHPLLLIRSFVLFATAKRHCCRLVLGGSGGGRLRPFVVIMNAAAAVHPIKHEMYEDDDDDDKSSELSSSVKRQKRTYVSDGVGMLESFDCLVDTNESALATTAGNYDNKNQEQGHELTLILGTLPSDKSYGNSLSVKDVILRGGGRGPQNYGHARNCFWNIVGTAFGFDRHQTSWNDQVLALTTNVVVTTTNMDTTTTATTTTANNRNNNNATTLIHTKFALWDVLKAARRKGSLDGNIVRESCLPNGIPKFLRDHPNCNRLVFAANSAEIFAKRDIFGSWLDTGIAPVQEVEVEGYSGDDKNDKVLTGGSPTSAVFFPNSITNNNTPTNMASEQISVFFWMKNETSNPHTFARTKTIFGNKKAVRTLSNVEEARAGAAKLSVGNNPPRIVELIVMPSTSPANAKMHPPEKEKIWYQACFGLTRPPATYKCPGCCHQFGSTTSKYFSSKKSTTTSSQYSPHWAADCPHLGKWKEAKQNAKKPTKKKGKELTADDIDPFDWYA